MASTKSYVIVHNQWSQSTARVPLPAMVGSDPACDIVINASAVAPQAYSLREQDGCLRLIHNKSGKELGSDGLDRYGFRLSRPLTCKSATLSDGSKIRELVAKHELWLARQPFWLRCALAGALRPKIRFSFWATTLGLLIAWIFVPTNKATVDYSETPIHIKMDQVASQIIGVTSQRVGYEKGAILAIDATPAQAKQALLLSFRAAKLDLGKELQIFTRKGLVFESSPMPNCIKQFCDIKVRLPAGSLQAGSNQIHLKHNPEGGFYIVGDILIRPLPKIKPEELRRVERWEQIANRAYNERDIVPENLVQVRRELDQAIDFLNTREGADPIRSRVEAFRNEAEEAFQQEVKDRWAKVDINQKLANYDSALFHLDRLRGLFPDTSSKEHQSVQNRMSQIKELQK